MKKISIFVDGGFLRTQAKKAKKNYDPEFIIKSAKSLIKEDEELFRIHYFDCEPFSGEVRLPISGEMKTYEKQSQLLSNLSREEYIALRKGILKFRGWERTKQSLKQDIKYANLTDNDFQPKFMQKGVDIRIGMDMINSADLKIVDAIILITNDTDLVPPIKTSRTRGLRIGCATLPNFNITPELKTHSDFFRILNLP